jgi:hypothetical protein
MIQRILAGSFTKEHHSLQHAHLALEIMAAFERNLPDIEKSDDNVSGGIGRLGTPY